MADITTFTPGSAQYVQSDNDVVNLADGINPDGSLNVVDNGAQLGALVTGSPFTINGSAGNHNPQNIDIAAPAVKSGGGRYLILVKNGINSDCAISVQHKEGATDFYEIATFTATANKNTGVIVQGWLLGAGRLVVDPAASGTGTVTVIVRVC